MKNLSKFICGAFLLATMSVSSASAAPEYTLSLNLAIAPIHNRWNMALKPWTEEITKRSNGRIVIEPYFAQALSKQSEIAESVKTGIADIGEAPFSGGQLGRFPFHEQLNNMIHPSLCLMDTISFAKEMAAAFPKEAAKDLAGTKILFLEANEVGMLIGTKNKPIKKLEDIKGLKIGVTGGGIRVDRVKALGATAVGQTMGDMYMSLEKGVIDGCVLDGETLISRKLGDVIKYITPLNFGGGLFYCVMNQDVFNSMPKDLQKIIDDVSTEFAVPLFKKFWSTMQYNSLKKWEDEMGGKLSLLSDEDYAKADALSENTLQSWHKLLKSKKMDSDAILKKYRELEAKYYKPWSKSEMIKYVNN